MRVVFVHGACVKDGAWWWGPTAELLVAEGVASETPALPSCGETGATRDAEGPGLAEHTMRACDVRARIPMSRGTDSLNVATAAALAFYERARRAD